jgi:hypothetical protein
MSAVSSSTYPVYRDQYGIAKVYDVVVCAVTYIQPSSINRKTVWSQYHRFPSIFQLPPPLARYRRVSCCPPREPIGNLPIGSTTTTCIPPTTTTICSRIQTRIGICLPKCLNISSKEPPWRVLVNRAVTLLLSSFGGDARHRAREARRLQSVLSNTETTRQFIKSPDTLSWLRLN